VLLNRLLVLLGPILLSVVKEEARFQAGDLESPTAPSHINEFIIFCEQVRQVSFSRHIIRPVVFETFSEHTQHV